MRIGKKKPEFLQEIVEPEIKTPEEDLKVSSNFTINGKEVSISSKKVEKHELQEIRNVGYF